MSINKDPSSLPPMIGKIGPYTVFMTPSPPSTPKPEAVSPPIKLVTAPVQPPPQQFVTKSFDDQDGSVLGFFKNAPAKLHNAHMSLDDHLARWFGLNQSKYQWALDDYYETKGMEKEGKEKETEI